MGQPPPPFFFLHSPPKLAVRPLSPQGKNTATLSMKKEGGREGPLRSLGRVARAEKVKKRDCKRSGEAAAERAAWVSDYSKPLCIWDGQFAVLKKNPTCWKWKEIRRRAHVETGTNARYYSKITKNPAASTVI